jgi:hypothetical protein
LSKVRKGHPTRSLFVEDPIDLKHIISKPSFARPGGRCEVAVCASRHGIDA